MHAYRKRLKELNAAHLVRLSNDAWGLVLFIVLLSFLQLKVSKLYTVEDLLHACLTITLITILIISFFSNPERESSRFVSSNIMFFAFFIALLTIAVEFDVFILLIGFLVLLWIYFFLCMEFPEMEEYEIKIFHLVLVAIVQLLIYSTVAVAFLGLPTL